MTNDPQDTTVYIPKSYIAIGALVVIILGTILFFVFDGLINPAQSSNPANGELPETYRGTVLNPPRIISDFTLTGMAGDPISLSDFQGRIVLLFFGYTHCPDFCPNTLSEYKQIERILGDESERVAFVFVSVDGERDTPPVLNTYLSAIDSDFIGMTGDEATLRRIGEPFGLYFEIRDDGLVDHTASTFMLDDAGRLVRVFSYGTEARIIAEVVQESF